MSNGRLTWWPAISRHFAQLSIAVFVLVVLCFVVLTAPMVWDITTEGRHAIQSATWVFEFAVVMFLFLPPAGVLFALAGIWHARRLGTIGLVCNGAIIALLVWLYFTAAPKGL